MALVNKKQLEPRLAIFPKAAGVLLCLLFLRLCYVQVVLGPELQQKAGISRPVEEEPKQPSIEAKDRVSETVAEATVRPKKTIGPLLSRLRQMLHRENR
jgi:hypothetical protein